MNVRRLIFGILLAFFFLYFFFKNIDLHLVWKVTKEGNPYWLLLAVIINLFNYLFRAYRWRFFFLPIKKTRIWNLFETTVIGFAVNCIFPAKVGEIVRPYLLGGRENISRSAAMATVVVERVFDSLSVLLMLVFYLLFLLQPEQLGAQARDSLHHLKRAGVVLFAAVIALLLFLIYLKRKPAVVRKIVSKIEKILPKRIAHSLDEILDSFIEGLSILDDPRILWKISYWSILFWLFICSGFWAAVRAYLPDFPFVSTFLLMTLLAIGIAVPTPGGVGSYHFACQIGLTRFFAVPESEAAAIALVSHFAAFVPVTLLGLVFMYREGFSTKQLRTIAEQKDAPE